MDTVSDRFCLCMINRQKNSNIKLPQVKTSGDRDEMNMNKGVLYSAAVAVGIWFLFRLFGSTDRNLVALIVFCTGIILIEIKKVR